MKIHILTESIKGLGLGHIVRSFNLALVFIKMGYEVNFFIRGNGEFEDFLKKQYDEYSCLNTLHCLSLQWEKITNKALLQCDICIIDSYHIADFNPFLESSKILVLFDDDGRHLSLLQDTITEWQEYLASRHSMNAAPFLQQSAESLDTDSPSLCSYDNHKKIAQLFLLNPNGFYLSHNILPHMRKHIFSGLEYALLNPCFQDSTLMQHAKTYEFFVCLGGEDLSDKSSEILKQLQAIATSITIVVGANYKGALLQSPYLCNNLYATQKIRVFHNISQSSLAYLVATSQCCIVSGGGIVFEALRLCRYVFAINLADNQNEQIMVLAKQGLLTEITLPLQSHILNHNNHTNNGISREFIGKSVEELASNLIMYAINYILHSKQYKEAKNFTFNTLSAINFCNLTADEAMRVLSYRNHPFVRENMYGSDIISINAHLKFLESLREDETIQYFLIQQSSDTDKPYDIGVISLTRINMKHRHAYLGIYKNPLIHHDSNHENYQDIKQANTNLSTSHNDTLSYKQPPHRHYGPLLMQVIRYIAFTQYNLNMLYLEVKANNARAIKLYENEGFIYMGTLSQGFRTQQNNNETYCDVHIYGIKNPFLE